MRMKLGTLKRIIREAVGEALSEGRPPPYDVDKNLQAAIAMNAHVRAHDAANAAKIAKEKRDNDIYNAAHRAEKAGDPVPMAQWKVKNWERFTNDAYGPYMADGFLKSIITVIDRNAYEDPAIKDNLVPLFDWASASAHAKSTLVSSAKDALVGKKLLVDAGYQV
jgi:hypothetical protein